MCLCVRSPYMSLFSLVRCLLSLLGGHRRTPNEDGIPNSFNILQTASPACWECRDSGGGGRERGRVGVGVAISCGAQTPPL